MAGAGTDRPTASPDRGAVDTVVIGGGPAGLCAAMYLARYRRSVLVADASRSRCAWIPRTHNHAGFPDGIPGPELLARMRVQALQYGARIEPGDVTALERAGSGFVTHLGDLPVRSPAVILATGVVDQLPRLPNLERAVLTGLVRLCPICDGHV